MSPVGCDHRFHLDRMELTTERHDNRWKVIHRWTLTECDGCGALPTKAEAAEVERDLSEWIDAPIALELPAWRIEPSPVEDRASTT